MQLIPEDGAENLIGGLFKFVGLTFIANNHPTRGGGREERVRFAYFLESNVIGENSS